MNEKRVFSLSGWFLLFLLIFGGVFTYFTIDISYVQSLFENGIIPIVLSITIILVLFMLFGFYSLEPNESAIMVFLGNYVGTDKKSGFRWTIPFFNITKASLRIQDFETEQIKVNDLNGNPIEISATVIWKVKDTYAAYFDVENYTKFITRQSISALRSLAMKYPYESTDTYIESLITHTEEVAENLKIQIQERVDMAGLEILEARINHLSYAKEIASAMLQRQQASAIISARKEIVEGAVGMVEMAIHDLESKKIVSFSSTDKTRLVTNLLVVLCSDQGTQPIIEAGN